MTYLKNLSLKDRGNRSGGSSGSGPSMIRVGLQDIRDTDKKGRWWLTGAAWVGNIGHHDERTTSAAGKGDSQSTAHEDKLMKLARAQRMNTDIRRSVFCVIMGSDDYLEA